LKNNKTLSVLSKDTLDKIENSSYYKDTLDAFGKMDFYFSKLREIYHQDGIYDLFKPLISKNGIYAIVEYSYSCGLLCGSGSVVLMKKKNDCWVILEELMSSTK
jgi:hypothetical protein